MRRTLLRLLLLITLLLVATVVIRRTGLLALLAPDHLASTIAAARAVSWAAPAFVASYAVASTIGLPASPFTLAGGAIFGTALGSLLNWMGATLGAGGAYLLARLLGGDAVRALLGRRAALLDHLAGAQAFAPLLRLRLIPVMPFNALNFGAGLAGVAPRPFLASTALGIIPGTVIYTAFAGALLSGATGARAEAFGQLAVASVLLLALSFAPRLLRRTGALAIALLLLEVPAPPVADAQSSPESAAVDHRPFDAMLRRYVSDGLVDYDGFAADPRFPAYLEALDRARPDDLDPKSRLAFWINAYNAYTIQLINSRRERSSIKNINKRFGVPMRSPWSEPIVHVGGRTMTLDDVEHRVIRPTFKEPRAHMALVCAALGCPPLRSEAYAGERLDAQLDDQSRRFLATAHKNRVDVGARTVYGSPIFTWYREDFGGTERGVGQFWARYVTDPAARALLLSGTFRWRDTEYDWSLNLRRTAPTSSPGSADP